MIDPLTDVATQMPRASRILETERVLNRAQNASLFSSIVGVQLFFFTYIAMGFLHVLLADHYGSLSDVSTDSVSNSCYVSVSEYVTCRLMFVDVVYCFIYIFNLPKLAFAEIVQGRSL